MHGGSMSHHYPDPENVEISAPEFTELEERIKASGLCEADGTLIIKSLQFMFWLQKSLEHAKLSIKKLQRLFEFSSKSKKQSDEPLAGNDEKISDNDSAPVNSTENNEPDTKEIKASDDECFIRY